MSIPLLAPNQGRKRSAEGLAGNTCVLCDNPCNDIAAVSKESWEKLKNHAINWRGLPKYGDAYNRVAWNDGPDERFLHRSCSREISGKRNLEQAKARQQKEQNRMETEAPVSDDRTIEAFEGEGRSSRSSLGKIHDKWLCVFCMKPQDSKHPNRKCSHLFRIDKLESWNSFREHATCPTDKMVRERLTRLSESTSDPFADDVRYHFHCWKQYVDRCSCKSAMRGTHSGEFQGISKSDVREIFLKHVYNVVIELNEPRSLQGLTKDYIQFYADYGFDVSGVRSSYIKDLIVDSPELRHIIAFHDRVHRNASTIVYHREMGGSFIEAALNFWGISNVQLMNALCRRVRDSLSLTTLMDWPPQLSSLKSEEDINELVRAMFIWLRDPAAKLDSTDLTSQARMLASFFTAYVTRKRTPAQVKMSVTVHGLVRSKEIAQILNKSGCGIPYNDILNLYDSWAAAEISEGDIVLAELQRNAPGVAITDNDDFKDDTSTGAGTSHRTNLMWIQRATNANEDVNCQLLSIPSKGQLAQAADTIGNIRSYVTLRKGTPGIHKQVDLTLPILPLMQSRALIHALVRMYEDGPPAPTEQSIPGFRGYQAQIRSSEPKSTPYYHVTLKEPPNKTTVHEVMCRVVSVAESKEMPFVVLCGDQPVYTLMVTLKNEHEAKFGKVLPFLAAFHTQCTFMACIYKRFQGSGLEDILVAADVVAAGSVEQALKGKNYKRGLRCYLLMYESLIRRVLTKANMNGKVIPQMFEPKLQLLSNCDTPDLLLRTWMELEQNEEFANFVKEVFDQIVPSDINEFWRSFMDMVGLLLENVHAVRTNDWELYLKSVRKMLPWLRVYDHDRYGKWLPHFWLKMIALPEDKKLCMPDLFAQSITGKPYSNLPLDMWIEMTMNKGSKLKSGWMRILKNERMLMVHTVNANNVNAVRVTLHEDLKTGFQYDHGHSESSSSRLVADELAVQNIEHCFQEYECDLMGGCVGDKIVSLQSGLLASEELTNDLKTAHDDGQKLVKQFFEDRLFSDQVLWEAPIRRNKRKNFSTRAVDKVNNKAVKTAKMETKAMIKIVDLLQQTANKDATLEDIFQHRLTDECLALFHTNGAQYKSQKSRLLLMMNFVSVPIPIDYITLIDVGMFLRLAIPTAEDRVNREFTYADFARRIMKIAMVRHPNSAMIIFVNDPYNLEFCVKDGERALRQQQYESGTRNIFMKPTDRFPSTPDFNRLLANDKNKCRLQTLIQEEIRKAVEEGITVIFSLQNTCTNLSSNTRIPEFECQQMEADTIIFYIYSQIRSKWLDTRPVVIDAENTDVLVLSSFVSHQHPGELLLKRKKEYVKAQELFPKDVAKYIVQFHVFTGCDSVSGFFGQSKTAVYKRAIELNLLPKLENLGRTPDIQDLTISAAEDFTRKSVYNDQNSCSMAEARSSKWRQMKRKCTQRLPPDVNTLYFHILRANYQIHIMINYAKLGPTLCPVERGWTLTCGKCLPVRNSRPALPEKFMIHYVTADADSDDSDDSSSSSADEL